MALGTGAAISHGAITVVNAIATGRGAALGIDLATHARVTLTETDDAEAPALEANVTIDGEPDEDATLALACVAHVLRRFNITTPIKAHVHTRSTIPISRGLKSSSAAANAIVLATAAALGKTVGDEAEDDLSHQDAIKLGVDAALEARVTITGAYDDASASYLGGLVVTENARRNIVHSEDPGDLEVILVVPPEKVRTFDTATAPTHPIRPLIDEAWTLAKQGRWQDAMLRNSLAYGAAYGLGNRLTLSMLDTGAIAAGISGTGPAIAVVVRRDDWDCFIDIIDQLAPGAEVLVAHTNNDKARRLATNSDDPNNDTSTLPAPQRIRPETSEPPKPEAA